MTVAQSALLARARDLLERADPATAGIWPRATALLTRQVLEAALDDLWRRRAPGVELCSARAQLLCLPAYLHGAEALAERVSYAWVGLSRASHQHAYELPPTSPELISWIEMVEQLVARVQDVVDPPEKAAEKAVTIFHEESRADVTNTQSQGPFGSFVVRIDPWAVEYGSETPTDFQVDPDDAVAVDPSVERNITEWAPVVPPPIDLPEQLAIVDGVRRMEARLVVADQERVLHGLLGAYGVGVVHCRNGQATFGEEIRGRVIIFGSGQRPPSPVTISPSLVYEPRSTAEQDPDAPLRELHREMRTVEEQFARRLATNLNVLVLVDGPLNIGEPTAGRVIGFVKRLFKLYLAPEQLPILRALPRGGRTPVFLIRSAGRFSRYSWFTRIAKRMPVESDFTGIVRLEVAECVGVADAIRLADMTTSVVPRFVPSRSRDPRAPQNLVPIGALEQHLRHGLGDPRLIHRRLATFLARSS